MKTGDRKKVTPNEWAWAQRAYIIMKSYEKWKQEKETRKKHLEWVCNNLRYTHALVGTGAIQLGVQLS